MRIGLLKTERLFIREVVVTAKMDKAVTRILWVIEMVNGLVHIVPCNAHKQKQELQGDRFDHVVAYKKI